MRKIKCYMITLPMILAATFVASACTQIKKEPEPVSLQLSFASNHGMVNPDYQKVYVDAAENFHKINPNITVTINYSSEPSLIRADLTKLLGNSESPDIIELDLNYLEIAEKNNLLFDLLKLQQSYEIDINQRIL